MAQTTTLVHSDLLALLILYYKNLAIILSQASLRALHRAVATQVGVNRFELASEVDAIIAFRKSTPRLFSHNPLSLTTPQAAVGVNTIAGEIAFQHFLDTILADLLQGPWVAIVRAILLWTLNQPSIPFQCQDEEVGNYMVDAIRSTPGDLAANSHPS